MKVCGVTMQYRSAVERVYTDWNLATDSFEMRLCSGEYVPDLDAHKVCKDLTNECSTGGYAAQSVKTLFTQKDLDGKAYLVFSIAGAVFKALNGEFKARYWVLCNTSHSGSPLFLCATIDSELHKKKKDTVITDGNSLTIEASDIWAVALG